MTSDHFASHLNEVPASADAAHADGIPEEMPSASSNRDAVDEISQHAAVQQKRALPRWLWATGTITLFVVGGLGYKKWFSTHSAPSLPLDNMSVSHIEQTNRPPTAHLPYENSGMLAGMPPHARTTSPLAEPEQSNDTSLDSVSVDMTSMQREATEKQAPEASTPSDSEEAIASMQLALEAKDREIAQLKEALLDARRSTTRTRSAAQRQTRAIQQARRNRSHIQPRPHSEMLLGFHIKQIVPGQGWVEDEESGKQMVLSVGDTLRGGAEVTHIDADRYEIRTTAGTIRF